MAINDLILIPGLLCDKRLWQHQLDVLGDMVDITIGETRLDETINSMAARILEDAPDKFALAGLSMGGYIAQEIMRQAPERVEKLALLNTSAIADDAAQIKRRKGLIQLVKMGRFKGVTPRLLPMLIHHDALENSQITSVITDMATNIGQNTFINQQKAILSRIDSRDDLKDINIDTLIICGRQDEITPIEIMQEIHDNIKKSNFHIIENCGHLSPLEQPKTVTNLMCDWLK